MKNNNLNSLTIQLIKDLQDDLNNMLKMNSNIEVAWELEKLQNEKAFEKSAILIRKSLEK